MTGFTIISGIDMVTGFNGCNYAPASFMAGGTLFRGIFEYAFHMAFFTV
jgi:hypothetical protein